MIQTERETSKRQPLSNPERQDARPLIQAICLGLALAAALTVAAALAQNEAKGKAHNSPHLKNAPAYERSLSPSSENDVSGFTLPTAY